MYECGDDERRGNERARICRAAARWNRIRRNGDQASITFFALPQQVFSALAFGHVSHETFQVTEGAVLRINPLASLPDPFDLTAFRKNSVGQLERAMLLKRGLNFMPDTLAVTWMDIFAIRGRSLYEVFFYGVTGQIRHSLTEILEYPATVISTTIHEAREIAD